MGGLFYLKGEIKDMKKFIIALLAVLTLGVCGCGNSDNEEFEIREIKEAGSIKSDSTSQNSEVSSDIDGEPMIDFIESPDMGAWVVYWDVDTAYEEMGQFEDGLSTLCYFSAYFDENNEPFIPQGTINTVNEIKAKGIFDSHASYLTFVNDKTLAEGSSLKDTELLYAVLGDEELAKTHAAKVLDMADELGCDGVEIDYEAIRKDKKLWGLFNEFTNILCDQAIARGMKVRILFEPSAPIEEYEWSDYPEYVMMCYNLYGYGTEPGPKANPGWIKQLVKKMEYLPGKINFALATGGFDFCEDGSIAAVNTAVAQKLEKDYGVTSERDDDSYDLVFKYTDNSGNEHEVWYADRETIKNWIDAVYQTGHSRITIWRLSGNI